MRPALLSAALLFVGSSLVCSEHHLLSAERRRSPWREQAAGQVTAPEARRARPWEQEGRQDPEEEGWKAKGSTGLLLSVDALCCLSPLLSWFNLGSSSSVVPPAFN